MIPELFGLEKEKTCLVGLKLKREPNHLIAESMAELEQLVVSAGGEVSAQVVQERIKPSPACFIGRGKAEEISSLCESKEIKLVVFDDDLTPGQQRNLEHIIGTRVIDRTGLILDIFAQRARTKEGKLQVELAQSNYLLPRLVGKGAAMSQLGGGIGTRGPGETQLEIDRRRIRRRIDKIKRDLQEVRKHRKLHRSKRKSVPLPVVALIGYTNAGKSSLLNRLTGARVLVEDKLFATLDPTTRRVRLNDGQLFLLSDTVGFIRKLPHHLIDAFKATLEEVLEADILAHVIDISHPEMEKHIQVVNELLAELGMSDKKVIRVLNKTDLVANRMELSCLKASHKEAVPVSVKLGCGLDDFLEAVERVLSTFIPLP
ncbi:MAG: GTPase HflX [bacterium]